MRRYWRQCVAWLFLRTYRVPSTQYVTTIPGMEGRPILVFESLRMLSGQECAQIGVLARAKGFEAFVCNGSIKFITVLTPPNTLQVRFTEDRLVARRSIDRVERSGYDECGAP